MKPNQEIRSKQELLNHFNSSQKLEIRDSEQMEDLLQMNVPPNVWKYALNKNLLSFSSEFVQETKEFTFDYRGIKYFYLIYFLTNLTELNLPGNKISDISSISKLKNLRKLQLRDNCIEDISALQSLTDLIYLDLSNNKQTSYTLTLPNLVELLLSRNSLQVISGLQHSPKLECLDLSWTETTDLRSIPHQLFGLKSDYFYQKSQIQVLFLTSYSV
ncbi:Protein_phosphatase 1 regulatory subunit SDS22 [Hexamita inflata]|uniref:Protein phosphatase 1 regulatory subunit SDS22 n=1 Tax=Hexamita inflata TaxID=28002 RepID=A0AA86TG11_9EUKA|nr:Protein phosphatase 1 regulatory subunit SDS22 [Hexamita inflata]